MRVALFKLAIVLDTTPCDGVAFSDQEEHEDWVRVSEWVDVEFVPIHVDIEEVKRNIQTRKIQKLKKELDKAMEKQP